MEQTTITQQYLQNDFEKYQLLNPPDTKLKRIAQPEELRLLSINKASLILGIRYETVAKLVKTGRIKSVMIASNKYKIPYLSLVEYVTGKNEPKVESSPSIPVEVTQSRIDNLFKEHCE